MSPMFVPTTICLHAFEGTRIYAAKAPLLRLDHCLWKQLRTGTTSCLCMASFLEMLSLKDSA